MTNIQGDDVNGMAAKADPLWRNRDYLLLTSGETVSSLGSAVASFALPLVIFGLTGSAFLAGVVATAGVLGNLSASLVVGGWVDSHSRRAAMVTSLATRTVTWFALAALVAFSSVNISLFVAIAFVGGVATALFRAAEAGALKEIVKRDQFPAAMSVIEGRSAAASLIGGPFGALLLGISAAMPFWANAFSFLASLIGVSSIKTNLGRPESRKQYRFLESIGDGLAYIWRQRAFRWILGGWAISNFGINAFNFTLVLILRQQGEPYWVIGLLESCIGVSILAGSFLVPYLIRKFDVGWIVIVSKAVVSVMIVLTAMFHTNVVAVLCFTAIGYLLMPASNAAAMSYLAVVTPQDYQGRVAAADEFASGALVPLATIAGGFLLHSLAADGTLITLAVVVIISTLLLLSSSAVRGLPRLAEAEESAAH